MSTAQLAAMELPPNDLETLEELKLLCDKVCLTMAEVVAVDRDTWCTLSRVILKNDVLTHVRLSLIRDKLQSHSVEESQQLRTDAARMPEPAADDQMEQNSSSIHDCHADGSPAVRDDSSVPSMEDLDGKARFVSPGAPRHNPRASIELLVPAVQRGQDYATIQETSGVESSFVSQETVPTNDTANTAAASLVQPRQLHRHLGISSPYDQSGKAKQQDPRSPNFASAENQTNKKKIPTNQAGTSSSSITTVNVNSVAQVTQPQVNNMIGLNGKTAEALDIPRILISSAPRKNPPPSQSVAPTETKQAVRGRRPIPIYLIESKDRNDAKNILHKFRAMKDATTISGVSKRTITQCCNGEIQQSSCNKVFVFAHAYDELLSKASEQEGGVASKKIFYDEYITAATNAFQPPTNPKTTLRSATLKRLPGHPKECTMQKPKKAICNGRRHKRGSSDIGFQNAATFAAFESLWREYIQSVIAKQTAGGPADRLRCSQKNDDTSTT